MKGEKNFLILEPQQIPPNQIIKGKKATFFPNFQNNKLILLLLFKESYGWIESNE